MSGGYSLLTKIRRLEDTCDKLGFMLSHSKHSYHREFGDVVALKPKDQDSLPIYSRDAELFVGTFDQLETWLQGLVWARDYDRMLFGNLHEAKRSRKEQDYRNKTLVRMLEKEYE